MRRGSILIIVVGIVSMLSMLVTGFLVRMRQDAGMADDVMRLAQNRIMLHAAICYVQEASRLGYAQMGPLGTCADPREAWGWIDTRVSVPAPATRVGPNATDGTPLHSPGRWPGLGGIVRAPMHLVRRPPFAVRPINTPNAIPADATRPTFGIPFLANCDPLPLLPEGAAFDPSAPAATADITGTDATGATVTRTARQAWAEGDPTIISQTSNQAWFRIRREDGSEPTGDPAEGRRPANAGPVGATFVITVGAGGTQGFRDWAEVQAEGAADRFGGDERLFDDLRATELRQWYRIEWSAAVGGGEDLVYANADRSRPAGAETTWHEGLPINGSRRVASATAISAPAMPRNTIGTIRYIQRLEVPPMGNRW